MEYLCNNSKVKKTKIIRNLVKDIKNRDKNILYSKVDFN